MLYLLSFRLSGKPGLVHFEDRVLAEFDQPYDFTRFTLDSIDLFRGLAPEDLAVVQTLIQSRQYEAGERILRKGDVGDTVLVVARGSVSISMDQEGAPPLRVGCLGPGQFFGELAALGGGIRTADVFADDRVICYVLSVEDLNALADSHPRVLAVILRNMAREFGNRVKRADAMIASLQ